MANNLKKFTTEAEYTAATLSYPAVSWVTSGDTVHFDHTAPTPPTFSGLTVYYNITNTSNEFTLFNGGGGGSCGSGSGGGGTMPTSMIIDGVEQTPVDTWRFTTTGEHIIQYTFGNNTVPTSFLNGFNTAVTKVEIGSVITAIGDDAFNLCRLTSATVDSTTPPTLGNYAFNNTNDCPIYVPSESVNDYKVAVGWSNYESRIEAIV